MTKYLFDDSGTEVYAGLRLESVANVREHWARKAKRTKEHRELGMLLAQSLGARPLDTIAGAVHVRVTIIRVAPRPLDGDNLQAAAKAFRDGVADAFRVADDDRRLSWVYAQAKGGRPRQYGVVLRFDVAPTTVAASPAPPPREALPSAGDP